MVDNVKEIIFQNGLAGEVDFPQSRLVRDHGLSILESLGRSFIDYVHPDDRRRNRDLLAPLIRQEKEYCRHEVRFLAAERGFAGWKSMCR